MSPRRNFTYAAQKKRRCRLVWILAFVALIIGGSAVGIAARFHPVLSNLTWTVRPAALVAVPAKTSKLQLELVGVHEIFERIAAAKTITIAAYSLKDTSPIVADLAAAADRGARASVALSRGFGMFVSTNRATAAFLENHHVRVHILESTTESTHVKVAIIDGEVYLSDRNWSPSDTRQIVIHDTVPGDRVLVERAILGDPGQNDHLWMRKADALAAEAEMLHVRHSNLVRVSSESFGPGTPVFDELLARAEAGDHIELLVAPSEYRHTGREQIAVADLQSHGVEVRLSTADEKVAIDGDFVWLGSTNATHGVPNQIDFGMRTSDKEIAHRLTAQFDAEWLSATLLTSISTEK